MWRSEHGGFKIEYAALVLLAATVITAVFAFGLPADVRVLYAEGLCRIMPGQEDCASDGEGGGQQAGGDGPETADPDTPDQQNGGQGPETVDTQNQLDDGSFQVTPALYEGPGTGVVVNASHGGDGPPTGLEDPNDLDHDRRDTGRDATGQRESDSGRRDDNEKPDPDLPGGEAPADGLGDPVDGEQVDVPEPPPWQPADEGAGEHGSDGWPVDDYAAKAAAEAGAHAMAGAWPEASRNLLHFMGNSGEPLEQDVDQMLEDLPGFRNEVEGTRRGLGAAAIEQARQEGADGPVTFPVNTAWTGHYIGEEHDKNWYLATGGMQYNLNGSVTVHPPEEEGGEWTYTMTTEVNFRDQYNWDGGKGTGIIPGVYVSDETLAEMHRAGVAQEFPMYGTSDSATTEGP
ncbi:hypothetical protein [Nocardiopsis sp. CNT-189]|uniref:hypothetical protein n=1 Tax=Nocardiopsis oceanisediminis TaxID=2816862 RepID=UPI003B3B9AA0